MAASTKEERNSVYLGSTSRRNGENNQHTGAEKRKYHRSGISAKRQSVKIWKTKGNIVQLTYHNLNDGVMAAAKAGEMKISVAWRGGKIETNGDE